MHILKSTFAFFIVCFVCASASAALREPYAEILDWSSLPVLTEDRCVHVSSADPTGGNLDYNNFVRENPDGSKVLADLTGPGCVTHIWLTMKRSLLDPASIRFYFDDRLTINMGIVGFFNQSTPPFTGPLIGEESRSSGGYYCYVPLPFQNSCRIEVANLGSGSFYYNIDATRYPDEDTVETFTWPLSTERQDLASQLIEQWNAPGTDPKGDLPGSREHTHTDRVFARESKTFFNLNESGMIARLQIRLTELPEWILRDCCLVIFWNGEETPAVDASFGEFFGVGSHGAELRSLAFGRSGTELYCYFPMPFETGALVEVRNQNRVLNANIEMEITVAPYPSGSSKLGRFYAVYNEETPADKSQNYLLMQLFGEGHLIGTVLSITGGALDFYPYLEGDEMIYVDSEWTPSIQGTGTEDYFNGGWYYKFGQFVQPLHGLPYKGSLLGETTQYRIHLPDKVPFSQHLRATIEHGANNTARADYRSVAFAYAIPRTPAVLSSPTPTPTPEPGSNLLINPGAENGITGWTGGGTPAYAPQIDPNTHIPNPPNHSGNHRFGLSVGWGTADCWQYQTVGVTPGPKYEAGLWFTRSNGTDEILEMLWINGPWPGTENRLYLSEGPEVATWTLLSGTTFVPQKDRITIVLRYRHPVGSDICSIHVDDVYLKQVAPPSRNGSTSAR